MSNAEADTGYSAGKGFLAKLLDGDYSLARTFWMYGFVPDMLVLGFFAYAPAFIAVGAWLGYTTAVTLIQPVIAGFDPLPGHWLAKFVFVVIPYTVYKIFVAVGTWKAANRYPGRKAWSFMAKSFVVASIVCLCSGSAGYVFLTRILHE